MNEASESARDEGRVFSSPARGRAWLARWARAGVDFVLPPRCPGCGLVTAEPDHFCPPCWLGLEHLGDLGCARCGQALAPGLEGEECAACLGGSSAIDRSRSVLAYGPVARDLVLRLKTGRKVALARTIARYMRVHVEAAGPDALLVPVPLHRWRLWQRGFNQSLLIARQLARMGGWQVAPGALRRTRYTPRLRGMSAAQRKRTVAHAFAADPAIAGRTLVLIDDVETTGATAEACAHALRRAGAGRVELVTWARVVRPRQPG